MPTVKRIICLANSRKLSGRCIAGRELIGGRLGGWIRPVSDRDSEEVSEEERGYQNGEDPRVLDIIDIPVLERRPRSYQRENWLLNPRFYWTKVMSVDASRLVDCVDADGSLWLNGDSTKTGLNDRIALEAASNLTSSLTLARVPSLRLRVFRPGASFGDDRRRVQAQFELAGEAYHLRVTDPVYERRFLAEPDGVHTLGASYLTISLGEPFEGHVYKLVAAIVEG